MSASSVAPLTPQGAVRVESIRVDRTPGIPDAFGVDALSPGLNLVFGPNASGKSSLLRALDALLWPAFTSSSERAVRGRLTDGDHSWDVRLDGTALTVHTADGVRVDTPVWPSPALRHRLHFALHDLLSVSRDPDAFASAIVRASAGGLDVLGAGQRVGMLERAPRTLAARRSFDEAARAVADAQAQQRALHEQRVSLEQWRTERDAAREASVQLQQVRHAQAWRTTQAQRAHAEAELAALPAALAQVRGDELEQADAIRVAWRDAQMRSDAALMRRARAESEQRAAFADAPPTREQREYWRRGLDAVRRTDAALTRTGAQRADRRAARDAAAAALSPHVKDGATPIDPEAIAEATAVAGRLDAALAAHTAAEAHAAVLDELHVDVTSRAAHDAAWGDRDTLRDAVRLLTEWLTADALRSAPLPASQGAMHWTLTVIAVIGWLVVAARWHVVAALLAVVTLTLALWRRPRASAEMRARAVADCTRLETEYAALGAPSPRTWDAATVAALMDGIARAVGDATVEARHREERRRSTARVAHTADALRVQQTEAAALAARTGLAPDTDGRTLGWLLERLARWQDAHSEYLRADAAWQDATREHGSALALMTDVTNTPRTVLDVEILVAAFEARWDAYAAATSAVSQSADAAQQADIEGARHAASWQALFQAVALEAPPLSPATVELPAHTALAALQARLAQRSTWLAYDAARGDAMRDLARLRAAVHDMGTFELLCAQPDAVLAEEAALLQARAETFEACVHQVSTLEERLEQAENSHAGEGALAVRAACRDAVLDEYARTVGAVLTHALVAHVQRETRDVQRPAVFHRARALFGRITRGAWRLHVEERDGVAHFRAEDTTTGVHHALETLSAGTRVQLLVAVRVAFVESEETDGVQLPLFFDETLGTSDDERADALIDAVLTLAAEGRQLFYVTAQRDEVQKWHAALTARTERGAAVPWREIDLAVVRRTAPLTAPVRLPLPRPNRTLSTDALQSHAAFGAATGVPPVDPARTPAVRWPLWYLTDDIPLLHATWQLGIERWGALAGYRDAGGTVQVVGRPALETATSLDELTHIAELAERLHTLSAVGIGRPVDRHALQECGVVSSAFLDLVVAQAERWAGDAGQLLAALDAGAVPRFGSARVEQLRTALRAGGWLAEAMALSVEEIRWGAIARSPRADAAELVDALLARLQPGTRGA